MAELAADNLAESTAKDNSSRANGRFQTIDTSLQTGGRVGNSKSLHIHYVSCANHRTRSCGSHMLMDQFDPSVQPLIALQSARITIKVS